MFCRTLLVELKFHCPANPLPIGERLGPLREPSILRPHAYR
jgi:hypothetical protein